MASLLLEQTRAAHEDIERLERSIVADYHGNPRGHRDKLAQAHRVRRALDAIKRKARWLVDEAHGVDAADGERLRAEVESLRGGADAEAFAVAAGDSDERVVSAALRAFDERLREARSYHARFRGGGGDEDVTMDDELAAATAAARARALGGGLGGGGAAGAATGAGGAALASSSLDAAAAALAADASALPSFTGEEAGGRCLDLHEHHLAFVNAASSGGFGRQDCDYSEFLSVLSSFDRLVAVPEGGGGEHGRRRQRQRRSRARSTAAWRRYLESLLSYLEDFFARTQPLSSLSRVYRDAGAEPASLFEKRWEAGEVEGWRDRGLGGGDDGDDDPLSPDAPPLALPAPALDLSNFSSAKELETLGADALRDALSALGLKAGGSVEQRATRLWLTKDAPLTSLDRKHFAKGSEVAAAVAAAASAVAKKERKKAASRLALPAPGDDHGDGNGTKAATDDGGASTRKKGASAARILEASSRASALLELKVSALLDGPLSAALEETRSSVEKKAARTYEEALADVEEREALDVGEAAAAAADGRAGDDEGGPSAYDSDSDEDDHVRNPLKLPLGWDGKPIPYWLYKLHGLDKEFECEVCGGHSYRGRREFERHFREARHSTGMRALGIPNTKEFYEVTRIADAQALWETLRERRKVGGVSGGAEGGGTRQPSSRASGSNAAVAADEMEEVDDEEGNVYDRRTYEDLKKQGIL